MPRKRANPGPKCPSALAQPFSLRAAELLSGKYRDEINVATMLGQSKTVFQAEIDAACELADFWRFNVYYAQRIMDEQPISPKGMWNQLQYRGLEGVVFAVSPFNFTSIGGNLPTSPVLMGCTAILETGHYRHLQQLGCDEDSARSRPARWRDPVPAFSRRKLY